MSVTPRERSRTAGGTDPGPWVSIRVRASTRAGGAAADAVAAPTPTAAAADEAVSPRAVSRSSSACRARDSRPVSVPSFHPSRSAASGWRTPSRSHSTNAVRSASAAGATSSWTAASRSPHGRVGDRVGRPPGRPPPLPLLAPHGRPPGLQARPGRRRRAATPPSGRRADPAGRRGPGPGTWPGRRPRRRRRAAAGAGRRPTPSARAGGPDSANAVSSWSAANRRSRSASATRGRPPRRRGPRRGGATVSSGESVHVPIVPAAPKFLHVVQEKLTTRGHSDSALPIERRQDSNAAVPVCASVSLSVQLLRRSLPCPPRPPPPAKKHAPPPRQGPAAVHRRQVGRQRLAARPSRRINPATGEAICQVAEGDKADVDLAVKAARKAFEDGPWPKMNAARARPAARTSSPTSIEKNTDELAALESLDNGKPYRRRARRRPAADDQVLPLLRRLGRQDPRQDDPDRRHLLLLHAARAGRRRRPDHPVELPAADAGVEVGPGPGDAATPSCSSPPSRRR